MENIMEKDLGCGFQTVLIHFHCIYTSGSETAGKQAYYSDCEYGKEQYLM